MNVRPFPCACRFDQEDEFSNASLLKDTECAYHAKMRQAVEDCESKLVIVRASIAAAEAGIRVGFQAVDNIRQGKKP